MPRQAISRSAETAERNRRNDPGQPRFAEPDDAAVAATGDIRAGADLAATMAATYSVGLLVLGMELPLGIARSWLAMIGGGGIH